MTVVKVETDIIIGITLRPKGKTVILVILYAETFKPDIVIFIGFKHIH